MLLMVGSSLSWDFASTPGATLLTFPLNFQHARETILLTFSWTFQDALAAKLLTCAWDFKELRSQLFLETFGNSLHTTLLAATRSWCCEYDFNSNQHAVSYTLSFLWEHSNALWITAKMLMVLHSWLSVQRAGGSASGPADQRISGPDQRISGPADQRISGSADQWISRPADQRISGSAGQRISGPAGQRIRGPADQRISGSANQRTSGSADQQISGPADQRISGSADQPAADESNLDDYGVFHVITLFQFVAGVLGITVPRW